MNIFKKALIVALSVGLISVPTVTKEVEAANMSGGEVLYLAPNTNWKQSNARFAAYFFGSGNTWASMTKSGSYYKVTVPSGSWTNVIFCRMNPSATANNWNNKWNQTGDFVWDGDKNLCTINSGQWDCGNNVTWSTHYEYKLTLNYNNEGATADKVIDLKAGKQTTDLGTTPTWDGHIFKGWSTAKDTTVEYAVGVAYNANVTGNVTLYAVWEEATKPIYPVTINVGSFTDTINVEDGTSVDKVIKDLSTKLNNNNLVVKEWDYTGNITGTTTINATKYYTTFDETEAQLGFDYSVKKQTRVWFQVAGENPCIWAINDSGEGQDFPMTKDKSKGESFSKYYYYADIPLEYTSVQYKYTKNGNEVKYPSDTTIERNYLENCFWFDSADSNGFFAVDGYEISNVDNLAIRFSTPDDLNYANFGGISSYGIDIVVNNKTDGYDNVYTKESGISEWDLVLYNINLSKINVDIKVVSYVVIDEEKINICKERTVSVKTLAQDYTSDTRLTELEKAANRFIVGLAA